MIFMIIIDIGGTKIVNIYKPSSWPTDPIQTGNSHRTQWIYLKKDNYGNALVEWYESLTMDLDTVIRWILLDIENYSRFQNDVTSTAKKIHPKRFSKRICPWLEC